MSVNLKQGLDALAEIAGRRESIDGSLHEFQQIEACGSCERPSGYLDLPHSSPRLTVIPFCSRSHVGGSRAIAASEFAIEGRKVAEAGTVGEGADA